MATTKSTTAKRPAAKKAGQSAKRTTTEARRTVNSLVLEGVYVTVGAGDTAVSFVRSLPAKATELGSELPGRAKTLVRKTPDRLQARMTEARTTASRELDTLSERGRKVVDAISGATSTKKAIDQTKVARSQVKAAATSIRKAISQTGEAVEDAADTVGEAQTA